LNETRCDDTGNISQIIKQKLISAGQHAQSHLRKKDLEKLAELGERPSVRTDDGSLLSFAVSVLNQEDLFPNEGYQFLDNRPKATMLEQST
jgi:hypothetical protein